MSKERDCRRNCETLISSRPNRREGLQQQLQDIEQKRHDLLPEHQRALERSKKIQSIQDKKRNLQKENVVAEEDVKQKEERVLFCRTKSKNDRTEDEMEAELQSLQAGEERTGSNASQGVNCRMEAVAEQLGIMGAEKAMYHFELCPRRSTECLRLRPLLSKCQEKKMESRGIRVVQ